MKVLLIRHGEPDYSIDSLTEKGWREARMLASRLSQMDILDFYVSPLGRARDTARPTLEKLGREAEILPWLHEFSGTIIDPCSGREHISWDIMPQYWTNQPLLFDRERWCDDPLIATGESARVFAETRAGFDALMARYGYVREGMIYKCVKGREDTIALFCHSCISLTIISYVLGIAPPILQNGAVLPTSSVTTLITEERKKGEALLRLFQLGDTSHLYAAGEPVSHSGLYKETFCEGA